MRNYTPTGSRRSCDLTFAEWLQDQETRIILLTRNQSRLGKQYRNINPLTPELNPSVQRCLTRFFTGDFASRTVHFVNICVKNQQIQQLFIQFIN
jgi:hypothetical protein